MGTTNTINVTACDNQLLICATQSGLSYAIVDLNSGFGNPVDATINIVAGAYQGGYYGNNVNGGSLPPGTVALPAGTYDLTCIGIDWGGPFQITFTVNGVQYGSSTSSYPPVEDIGVLWSTGTTPITITVS
ncbi:MAG TPA: hypothetical protein DD490_20945 [Acidobacteria bacterium]|nr:hypothetical protein [Acidobacteriota bacterium]